MDSGRSKGVGDSRIVRPYCRKSGEDWTDRLDGLAVPESVKGGTTERFCLEGILMNGEERRTVGLRPGDWVRSVVILSSQVRGSSNVKVRVGVFVEDLQAVA